MEVKTVGHGCVWVSAGGWTEGLDIATVAARLGVTVQTVRRWGRGAPIPKPAQIALQALVVGQLVQPGFEAWRVYDGRLWAPNGLGFRPAEIEHWSWVWQHNRILLRERRRLSGDGYGAGSSPWPCEPRSSSAGSPS